MDFFNQLGTLIRQHWRSKRFEEEAFAQVATDALNEMPPARAVGPAGIVRRAVRGDRLVAPPINSDFGSAPVNVYKHARFSIEVVFWLDDTTGIHQHAFSGAFHVLAGAGLHSRYAFDLHEAVNSRLLLGALRLREVEYLPAGETRPIRRGRGFIHAVFPLDRPSVSVVVRTPTDQEALPQYAYFKPSVAYAIFDQPERITRRLRLLGLLREAGQPRWHRSLGELIAGADFETAFLALRQHHPHLDADQLAALLDQARRRHGRLVDHLPPVFEEDRRLTALADKRRSLRDPQHRLLLALLLNLPDRASILDVVRRRYDGDPADRIVTWLDGLRQLPGADGEPNALGMNVNEVTLEVVRCLLEGRPFAGVKERLKGQYEAAEVDGQEEELRQLCGELRRSVLLRPLFVESVPGAVHPSLPPRFVEEGVHTSRSRGEAIDPVANTARAAAALRALESERPDRLFCDPWARALAGAEGFALLKFLQRRHPLAWGESTEAGIAVRTRFFDDLALRTRAEGVRQLVLVGAGMDTRAFRLDWPAATTWYELDRPELLGLKDEILRRVGARAGCRRVPLGVDLEADWVPALVTAGFVQGEPSLWVAEGFFYYLPERAVRHVLAQLSAVAAPGSVLGANLPGGALFTNPPLAAQEMLRSLDERGMPWQFGTDDPEGLLAGYGWQAQVTQGGEEGANYGRWPYPVLPRTNREGGRTFFVVGRKL